MQIYNKQTKVSDITENKIPDGWTDKAPKWVPFETWCESADNWGVSTDLYKQDKIEKCRLASSNSIYAAYPIYKQQNLASDANYASQALALELGKPIEQIGLDMNALVIPIKTVEDLLTFREGIPTMDLSTFVANSAAELKVKHTAYYRAIIESIVGYRLVKCVREWCNTKEALIESCATVQEIEVIVLDDCPVI